MGFLRKELNHLNLQNIINEEVGEVAKDVLCEVNNCKYWSKGNKCSADEIYVVSHRGNQASKSEETDCKTFVPEA